MNKLEKSRTPPLNTELPGGSPRIHTLIIGLSAMLLHLFAQKQPEYFTILSSGAAVLLYFAALFLPYRFSLLTIGIFCFSCIAPLIEPITTIRIIVIATSLAGICKSRPSLAPFISLASLWFLVMVVTFSLKLLGLSFIDNAALIPSTEHLLLSLFIESVGVLGMGLLLFSRKLHRFFGRQSMLLSSRVFFVHVTACTVILCFYGFGMALFSNQDLPIAATIALFLRQQPIAGMLAFFLLALPICIGLLLASSTNKMIRTLTLAAQENPLHLSHQRGLLCAEVIEATRSIQANVNRLLGNIRERDEEIRALRLQGKEKEKEILAQADKDRHISWLLNALPWGTISCTTNGVITAINHEAVKMLGLPATTLTGKTLAEAEGAHPWPKELSQIIFQTCRDLHKQLQQHPTMFSTSTVDSHYLECHLRIHTGQITQPVYETEQFGAVGPLATETSLMISMRKVPELRDFLLRRLAPSEAEVIGAHVRELLKPLRSQLDFISQETEDIHQTLAGLVDGNGIPFEQTSLGINLTKRLLQIVDSATSSSGELQEFETLTENSSKDSIRLNFSQTLRLLLNFFQTLFPVQATRIHFMNHLDQEEHDLKRDSLPPCNDAEDVFLIARESAITQFLSYTLALIKSVMAKTSDIHISVGYESIESEMVHIIPGSHPGHYVRLVIRHGGQSLTANMLTGKLHRLHSDNRDISETEHALTLLHHQAIQLGGFISVQSTVSKGTVLTIYIPINRTLESLAQQLNTQRRQTKTILPPTESEHSILIIGTRLEIDRKLLTQLEQLGFQGRIQSLPELLEESNGPMSFMGSGFNAEDPTHDIQQSLLANYQLVIFHVERPTREMIVLLHQLKDQQSPPRILLLIDGSDEQQALFADWPTLAKPYDLVQLDRAIRSLLA